MFGPWTGGLMSDQAAPPTLRAARQSASSVGGADPSATTPRTQHPLPEALTDVEMQAYRSQGYILRRAVFSRVEIEQLNAVIDPLAAAAVARSHEGHEYRIDGRRFVDLGDQTLQFEPAPFEQNLRVLEPAHPLSSAVLTLLRDARLVQPMQALTGSDHVSLWTDKINFKRPGGSEFGWHQDAPYWMHDATHLTQLPNVMVTLDDVVPGSGGFRVVQGSHQAGIYPARNDGTQLEGFYTHDDQVDFSQVIEFNEPAGSAIFFDPFLIHGSACNQSGKRRRALIATYQPANLPTLKTKQVVNLG
jgi:hypothetical protein